MRSSWSDKGRPAHGRRDSDRCCPLGTGLDRLMWHVSGMAAEDGPGSDMSALASALARVKGVTISTVPRMVAGLPKEAWQRYSLILIGIKGDHYRNNGETIRLHPHSDRISLPLSH